MKVEVISKFEIGDIVKWISRRGRVVDIKWNSIDYSFLYLVEELDGSRNWAREKQLEGVTDD